jgi:hypothetical protein
MAPPGNRREDVESSSIALLDLQIPGVIKNMHRLSERFDYRYATEV